MIDKSQLISQLRCRLSSHKPSIGSWLQIPSSATAEIMASSGYDWLAVDLEHGSFSTSQLPDIFRSIELYNCLPFVRVSSHSFVDLQCALDAGAAGLIIPNIVSLEDVNYIYCYANWPPAGKRGVGFSRSNLYGKNFKYFQSFNQSIFLVGMIESSEALDKLPLILESRKLDSILIGPYDLSASLSITGSFNSPKFKSAIDTIFNLCKKYSTPCGFHVVEPSPSSLYEKIDSGYLFNAFSIDSLFLSNFSNCPSLD